MKPADDHEEALFREALQRPKGAERQAFLDQGCAGNQALRARLESLLKGHESPDPFLESPTVPAGSATLLLALEEGPRTVIGHYKLLEQLGEGGMGTVWVAEQTQPIRREVALKVIKLGMDTKQVVARFEAERQALAMMDHPNIAKVLDAGATEAGRPYFVMERVKGIPITDYCDQHNLSTVERLDLFVQVCHAIQHAHQKGIIHRDIKPSNILVTVQDGKPVAKVIDFGIAKATAGQVLTDRTVYTAFEQFMGTPTYMSPEQAEMSALDIDTRSDIYSLGVLLYELLIGKTPFDPKRLAEAGLEEIRRIVREEEPPLPSSRLSALTAEEQTTTAKRRHTDAHQLVHLVRGDLDWIVIKCLEKDRLRRYDTAQGLALDLERHLTDRPIAARPPSRLYRFQRLVRRNQRAVTVASGAAIFTLLAVLITVWLLRGPVSRVLADPPPKPLPPNVQVLAAGAVLGLIYTGAPPVAPPRIPAPQLQFQIQAKRRGATDFSNLQDGDTLASEVDDYLLVAHALSEGYLYIFQVDALGKKQWLFPENETSELSSGANPAKPGQVLQVPSAQQKAFYLDQTAGIEHIYVVFSASRWPELEAALSLPPPSPSPGSPVEVVQAPNHLQTRGIGGTHDDAVTANVAVSLSAERAQDGQTYKLSVGGQSFEASGAFLVIERWFRHVNGSGIK